MKQASLVAALVLSLAAPLAVRAEVPTSAPPQIRTQMDTFFSTLAAGKSSEAVAGLLTAKIYQDKKQDVQNLALLFDTAFRNYGKPIGWELVAELKKSNYYYNQIYMLRTEQLPLFIHMAYYKDTVIGNWEVAKISFADTDDDISLK